MCEEDSPSMLPSVIQKDSRYRKLDIGYGSPKFFGCEAASNVWQLTQMMPLKLRNDGILESNNQIALLAHLSCSIPLLSRRQRVH